MSQEGNKTDNQWLKTSFLGVQEVLEAQLGLARVSIGHTSSKGDVAEDHWIEIFRNYLPRRYEVAKAIVIDNFGHRSEQIDIVIFDGQYTPTLLDQQGHRYIPAEAVYAVFETKPHIDKSYVEYAGEKAASVRKLIRTSAPITDFRGTHSPKPHFPIVAGIVAAETDWTDGLGRSFRNCLPAAGDNFIDCGCALDDGAFDSFSGELNIHDSDGALVLFLFRLLGKLQSMGTVPAIDWSAYAKVLAE